MNNLIKGLKGDKEEQQLNNAKGREIVIAHLESIFSRFPFSEPFSFEDLELQIGELCCTPLYHTLLLLLFLRRINNGSSFTP